MYMKIIEQAVDEALKSNVKKARIGAILCSRNGHRYLGAHNTKLYGNDDFTVHAEQALVDKMRKTKMVERYPDRRLYVLVVRVMADGSLGMACPCIECQKKLRNFSGIGIHYSNEFGEIELLEKT